MDDWSDSSREGRPKRCDSFSEIENGITLSNLVFHMFDK